MRLRTALIATAITIALTASAEARHRHHHGGGLICGLTQMLHFHIKDNNFRLALHWATFPHTSPAPEMVVVQRRNGHDSAGHPGGHVSRIVEVKSSCRAVVADDKGRYERDICKRLVAIVNPRG